MEAEKSHDLPCIRQSESKDLKMGRQWCTSQDTKALEPGTLTSKARRKCTSQMKKKEFDLPLPLVPFVPPKDWMRHIHIGEVNLFTYLPNQMSVFLRNILRDTPRNNILPALWDSPRPVRLTHRINHHTPTDRKTSGMVKTCWVNARTLASWHC